MGVINPSGWIGGNETTNIVAWGSSFQSVQGTNEKTMRHVSNLVGCPAMRRFELVEGSSNKFWQIEQDGPKLTIQWGKIGTSGQSRVKDFASDAQAIAEHDKLVKEKTKKGYVEVAAVADVGSPSVKSGTSVPAAEALLAASGPATPSIAPLPNSSGCFDSFFSVMYDRNVGSSAPPAGSAPNGNP